MYASDLLAHARLADANTTCTPIEPKTYLIPLDGTLLGDPMYYNQLVGSLFYLIVTRAYIVHIVI